MNAQRWLAIGLVALIVLCIAASNLWFVPLIEEVDEETPTPASEMKPSDEEGSSPSTSGNLLLTPEATIDPIIAELMESARLDALAVGDEPYIIMAGDFTVIDAMHRGEGTVSIYQIGDVRRVLRLDPFSVTSGPDLHILLSQHPLPRTSSDALQPTHVDLGLLKSNMGAQNYEIPDEVNLTIFRSVVIYSMSFHIIFSTATLEQVRG